MIKKGADAIKESLSKGNGTKDYQETTWINWKSGESKVIRFITDIEDILVVSVHAMVDTYDGKKGSFVCRKVFDAPCELCQKEVYKKDSGYGIAVVREAVTEEGKLVGYKDQTVEIEEETENGVVKRVKPVVGIVNQSMRNFWNNIALVNERFGSLNSFDIEIARQGAGKDTTYVPFPLPPKEIDNFEERYANFVPDLEAFLERIGSEEYYLSRLHGIEPDKDEKDNSSDSNGNFTKSYSDGPLYNPSEDFSEMTTADRLKAKLVESETPYN